VTVPWRGPEYEGEVPTLGWDILDWITDYLVVPDGPAAGEPLELTPEQAQFILNFYRVDPKFKGPAIVGREPGQRPADQPRDPVPAEGLGQVADPRRARDRRGVGDVILDGWDADGEPVGRPWTSLGFKAKVQVLATAEDQTQNTWDPLLEMVRGSENLIDDYGSTRWRPSSPAPGSGSSTPPRPATPARAAGPVFAVSTRPSRGRRRTAA
jgi:hypothetical protein